MSKICVKLGYGLATLYRGQIFKTFKHFLKFPQYFVTGCLKVTKEKKVEVLCMLFQITHISFNELIMSRYTLS